MAGLVVCWHRGVWTLEQNGKCRAVTILAGSTFLPWLIYLAWRDCAGQGSGAVFLFADSAPADDLRRLRVRLTLER